MFKKISLMTFVIFSQIIITSEQEIPIINLEDIPWTISRDSSEINNDSFRASVISEYNPIEYEASNETNNTGD